MLLKSRQCHTILAFGQSLTYVEVAYLWLSFSNFTDNYKNVTLFPIHVSMFNTTDTENKIYATIAKITVPNKTHSPQ